MQRDIFKPDKFDVNSDKSYLNTSEEKESCCYNVKNV